VRGEMKPVDKVRKCSECEELYEDGENLRCSLYDNAIVEDISEKQCQDSIK
jgi:hypothetical protein